MLAQRLEDRLAVAFELGRLADVFGREAAAEIDDRQIDAALGAGAKHRRRGGECAVPGFDIVLLRTDMEGNAVRHQAVLVGMFQDVGGIGRLAAELARQRPFGAGAVAVDTADHPAAGRRARHLLDLGLAVDREQRDAEAEGLGDLALFLDGVAVGDPVGRRAGGEHVVRLGDRGDVEAAAQPDQQLEDFRRRIGLHRVEHSWCPAAPWRSYDSSRGRHRGRRRGRVRYWCVA